MSTWGSAVVLATLFGAMVWVIRRFNRRRWSGVFLHLLCGLSRIAKSSTASHSEWDHGYKARRERSLGDGVGAFRFSPTPDSD